MFERIKELNTLLKLPGQHSVDHVVLITAAKSKNLQEILEETSFKLIILQSTGLKSILY